MVREEKSRVAYLDLLASTLTEHEKNLATLISKIEKLLGKISKKIEQPQENLIYVKLPLNRPIEELKMILEALKG